MIRVGLVGDVNLRNFSIKSSPFQFLDSYLKGIHCLFGDLEGCFYDENVDLYYKPGWFHVGEGRGKLLHQAGFKAVGMANNVTYGEQAINATIKELDELAIAHTGAGRNIESAIKPAVITVNNKRIGFLAYTSVFWPFGQAATSNQAGVATIRVLTAYQPNPRTIEMPGAPPKVITEVNNDDLQALINRVKKLREEVDILVSSFHWGVSGSSEVLDYQKELAHALIDEGADVILGHHPHVIQPIEVYKGRPIFYSLGNFIFGWERMKPPWIGLAFKVDFKDNNEIESAVGYFVRREEDELESHIVITKEINEEVEFLRSSSPAVQAEQEFITVEV